MSLLAVGLSHRSAPHALLERPARSTERTGKLLAYLAASPNVHEAAALATCNRIEVYAGVDKFHAAVTEVTELLSVHTGIEPAEPGKMSLTSTVPASVPSLFHNSTPWTPSSTVK